MAKDNESLKASHERLLQEVEELRAANAELERSARIKDDFLAAMGHELRTPLNAVLSLLRALRD